MASFTEQFVASCELEGGLGVQRGPFDTHDDAVLAAEADEETVVGEDGNGDPIYGDPIPVLAYSIRSRFERD